MLAISALFTPAGLGAQAAIDPNVAPRAAALERSGERQMAIDLLGRYLATAPDDGRAWFQLGRFYLLDAQDWHLQGHRGDPDGLLYLDFAATAFDQAIRLSVDSGIVFRGLAELERSVVWRTQGGGWHGPAGSGQTLLRCLPSFWSSALIC
jgi:tetratricopeptide (TPR) repeat protein